MHGKAFLYAVAGALALLCSSQQTAPRLYDNFSSGANWALTANGGFSVISGSSLTLTSPAHGQSTPTAILNSTQTLTGTRQSILVRAHTGFDHSTVFFFWAIDKATGNMLELKLDDVSPTIVVAGYYTGGGTTYNFVGTAPYSPGQDGLYMAFREANGITYWEVSPDASTWTEVATLSDPVSTSNVTFELQHKAYVTTSTTTYTIVDSFNYKATGAGYHSLEDKNSTGTGGWELYTEGFNGGVRVCFLPGGSPCDMTVNDVDSTQHFTDTSIPAPFTNQLGYDFQITSTAELTTRNYYNAFRYQTLPFVDADLWTYHLYFKYTYSQYIVEGLEFPINKYTGSYRVQGAVGWYPLRDGSHNGQWSVWSGNQWVPTGNYQTLLPNLWYEVAFTVGLHDNQVYYNGFSAGNVGSMSNFCWNATYGATPDPHAPNILPAMQIDDNIEDTTVADTRKDCYMAEWHIDWADERLP